MLPVFFYIPVYIYRRIKLISSALGLIFLQTQPRLSYDVPSMLSGGCVVLKSPKTVTSDLLTGLRMTSCPMKYIN